MNATAEIPGINAGVQILVEHGFSDGEAYALLADDTEDSSYKEAWNKLRRQVPEADDFFGPLFHKPNQKDISNDPDLVASRLDLTPEEMKILGAIESSLSN